MRDATVRAAAFAREFGAAITLLHVVKPDQSFITHGFARLQLAEAERDARRVPT